jgi:hypothetical protein
LDGVKIAFGVISLRDGELTNLRLVEDSFADENLMV